MTKKEWEELIEWKLAAARCIGNQQEYEEEIERIRLFVLKHAKPFARSLLWRVDE